MLFEEEGVSPVVFNNDIQQTQETCFINIDYVN